MLEKRALVDKKYLLIDLDGTLIDTADVTFKPMKDGQERVNLSQIKVFEGTENFLEETNDLGFKHIIVSDSHPKYVRQIVKEFFGNVPALSLADKPNTSKTLNFLQEQNIDISSCECYVIGDSWLDIELGRGLRVPTVLTEFYTAETIENRDGIGDYKKNIKSGSTYCVKSYASLLEILRNPLQYLLCLEAGFRGIESYTGRRINSYKQKDGKRTLHMVLARQSQGECDQYCATEKYFEFNRTDRSRELLLAIRDAVTVYISWVLQRKSYSWNIFTYVPDKQTTQPANKMGELFNMISEQIRQRTTDLLCLNIFEWSEEINSSTRRQPTRAERYEFVSSNLNLRTEVDVKQKSVIILDDQYTTGATADALVEKLRARGAKDVLFVALFHLVTPVNSSKLCPICLRNGLTKQLQVKINRTTGNKFYSCVLPRYGGDGCGYTENIE